MDQTSHLNNPEVDTDVDYSLVKVNIIGFLGVAAAAFLSYSLSLFYGSLSSAHLAVFVLAATVFLILLFIKTIFLKELSRFGAFLFLEGIGLFSFFIFGSLIFIVSGVIAACLFIFFSYRAGRNEVKYGLKIKPRRIARAVLPKGITALSFFVVLGYLSLNHANVAVISQETFNRIVMPSETIIHYFYPQISLSDTFADAVSKYVTSGLENNATFKALPPALKTAQTELAVGNFKDMIQKEYLNNVKFSDDDKLIDVLYKSFTEFLKGVPADKQTWITLALGIVFFLMVQSLGMIFYLVVALLAVFIYEILIASGLGVVALETQSKEIIIMK